MFTGIVDKAKDIPKLKYILPYLNSEPFMDSRFFERFDYVIETLPDVKYILYTNGTLLNDKIIKGLEQRKEHIESLTVSMSYTDKSSYEDQVGLKWNDIIGALELLKQSALLNKITIKILQSEHNNIYMVKSFIDIYSIYFNTVISKFINWAGKKDDKLTPALDMNCTCDRIKTDVSVYWDGRVGLCCMDNEGEVIIGNLCNESFKEIYESKVHQKYLDYMYTGKKNKLMLCNACNMMSKSKQGE